MRNTIIHERMNGRMADNNFGESKPQAPSCPYPSCGCIGYGYVPIQELECVYETDTALSKGTLFPELDLSISEYGNVCKRWGGTVCE